MRGDVVVVPFPFSDLSGSKRRPALVVAELRGDDIILCQITTRLRMDGYGVELEPADFENGGLIQLSAVRPNRIFTADRSLILAVVGRLHQSKFTEVVRRVIGIFELER